MKTTILLALAMMTSLALKAECTPGMIKDSVAIKVALTDLITNQDSIVRDGAQSFTSLPLSFCSSEEDGSSHTVSARIQRSYTHSGHTVRKLWAYKMVSNTTCNGFEIKLIETRNGDWLPNGCNGLYNSTVNN